MKYLRTLQENQRSRIRWTLLATAIVFQLIGLEILPRPNILNGIHFYFISLGLIFISILFSKSWKEMVTNFIVVHLPMPLYIGSMVLIILFLEAFLGGGFSSFVQHTSVIGYVFLVTLIFLTSISLPYAISAVAAKSIFLRIKRNQSRQ